MKVRSVGQGFDKKKGTLIYVLNKWVGGEEEEEEDGEDGDDGGDDEGEEEKKEKNIRYTRHEFIDSAKCEVPVLFTHKLKTGRQTERIMHGIAPPLLSSSISNMRE